MQAETIRETDRPDRDELFEALADRRRRRVVVVLRAAGKRLTLTELAEELARRAGGDADPSATDVDRTRIDLYHRHLPRLAETGLVEFDVARKTARLSGTVPEAAVAETDHALEIE